MLASRLPGADTNLVQPCPMAGQKPFPARFVAPNMTELCWWPNLNLLKQTEKCPGKAKQEVTGDEPTPRRLMGSSR